MLGSSLIAAATGIRPKPLLLVEADTGKVLHAENATYPWYPASITKLMTTYVTLQRREGRAHHARHAAHRLAERGGAAAVEDGLPGRHQVTVDNALKMMMVKSANDIVGRAGRGRLAARSRTSPTR